MEPNTPESLAELVVKNRSYRRFRDDVAVGAETLRDLVELARLSASGRNVQPLKYILSSDPATNAAIFPCLAWAGYLTRWPGPAANERPAAYIVILGDTELSQSFGVDEGLVLQNMLLGAVARGLGGCIIGSVRRDQLRRILNIQERYEILHVLALGAPAETVVIDEVGPDGDIKYWRDGEDIHHVPKRRLADVILSEFGSP